MDAICFQLCDGNVIGSFCNWKTFLSRPLLPSLPFSYSLVSFSFLLHPRLTLTSFTLRLERLSSSAKVNTVMCRRISWMDALGAFSKMSNQQRLVILTTFAIWAFWLLGFVCTQMDFKEEERFCCCPGLTDEVSEKPVDPNDPWRVNNNRILRISLNTSVLIDNETAYLGTIYLVTFRNFQSEFE